MKTFSSNSPARLRGDAAFTMVEIAIALGVIAIALIAIIGILPSGLQVSRDNREDTLVNQDARLLIEAIRTGRRNIFQDIGSHVQAVNNVATPGGITNLVQLLSDTNQYDIVMASISGAIAVRKDADFGFRYHIRKNVTNALDFVNTPLSNQVYEIRLRFAWPVLADFNPASEANTYVARTLISGYQSAETFFYAQHYIQPLNFAPTNSVP